MNINTIAKLYDHLPFGILLTSKDNKILYFNRAFEKLTHYSSEQLLDKPIDHILQSNQLLTEDHQLIDIELNVSLVELKNISFKCYAISITSEDKLRNDLQTEVERMNEAKKLAKFGHWELDLRSNDLYWSDEVYQMFDVDKNKFAPTYDAFLKNIHPDDVKMVDNAYINSIKDHTEYEINHRIIINDDILYYKEKGKSFYENNVPVRSIGLVQDITELVKKDMEVKAKEEELLKTKSAIINSLSGITDMRDHETGKHIQRTQIYVKLIAEYLRDTGDQRFDDEFISLLVQVSSLHDIGKVGIPDSILLKPGKLTQEEFEIMKTHTTIGYNVIEETKISSGLINSLYLNTTQKIILHHHERWDGTGYPNGLNGHQISIEGRIMSLVDVYDALRSKRVYKEAYAHEKALEIIAAESGKQFDPKLIEIFLKIEKDFEKISNELKD